MLKALPFICLLSSILAACSPATSTPPSTGTASPSQQATLTAAERHKIGQKIWHNESGGKISGLTHWNQGEEFPSMGIGHFIWYPQGFNGRWTESFPRFIRYAQQRGSRGIPGWVLESRHCPWPDRASFMKDFNGPRLTSLRHYLSQNITLQTDFIITTSNAALPNILAAAPAKDKPRITRHYQQLSTTPNGTYALIDYVNFKGDGTNPQERYQGSGWGLMWVLMEMQGSPSGQAAAAEFSAAAKRCLDRRIRNAPPARGESRWRAGWHNRCNTYARQL